MWLASRSAASRGGPLNTLLVGYALGATLIVGPSPTFSPEFQSTPPPAAVSPGPVVQDSLPSLTGVVRVEGLGALEPLSGAVVEVRQGATTRRTRAASGGEYVIAALRPGPATLAVFHIGAHPFEVSLRLPSRGRIEVDLDLRRRLVQLDPVPVAAAPEVPARARVVDRPPSSGPAIGLRSLEATSGLVESGLASAVSGDEPSASDRILYLRGSAIDARLVLLDGVPVLTPFHVAGLLEPFDPELIGVTDLYVGGAPARYGEGVSYVTDLASRRARTDGVRFEGTADGLVLGGRLETPLPGNGGLLVGGRLLHGAQELLATDEAFPYRYDDLLVRLDLAPALAHQLRATGFRNREGVRLSVPGAPAAGEARWGNDAASVGYVGRIGDVSLRGTATASRYESGLPVEWTEPVNARGFGDRVGGSVELGLGAWGGGLQAGASLEAIEFGYGFGTPTQPIASEFLTVSTTRAGAFAEWEGPVEPGFGLRAGIRADRYSHEKVVHLSPRVAISLDLGDRATLTSSTGLYRQVLPSPGLRLEGGVDAADAVVDWDPSLLVASASHLVVSLEQEVDERLRVGLSGFLKNFSGLGEGLERSRASGAELRVSREGEWASAWLGYALSWFWVDEGPSGSTRFDGRQLLSVGGEGRLPVGVQLRGTLGYGAGLPVTAVGLPSRALTSTAVDEGFSPPPVQSSGGTDPLELVAPERDFLRLDLEASWPFDRRIGGRETTFRPYVRVLNALNRRDPLFYYYDRWLEEGVRPLADRPILPLIGLEWRF